jgi:group II intron reverse transcriptase/maturase
MQLAEVAGSQKAIQRLEVIRQLNARSGWINRSLYKLMFSPDLYILAYERIKSEPGNMTPGTDNETLDGFSMDEINQLVQEMRSEQYQCKPVRRTYIPKSNGKMRKLGIPCTRDKVVQEVVRLILEAIYDSPHGSHFKDTSHGFRREKSCHSALQEIQRRWTGVTWFVEGDIQNCFDDIDHETLVSIIREKIKDERFINLIRKILKAGYQDLDEVRKDSLAGTPQGGIVSPILANIYLHKLDEFVEQLQGELEKGGKRKHNLEYKRLQDRTLYLAKQGKTRSREYKELGIRMRKLPSMDTEDPDFIRVKYIRYADDWIIGVTGPYQLAKEIKQRVRDFLKTELKLTLSEGKTVITNARTQEAKFLGYKIRLGRTNREQKQAVTTNGSGKIFKRRSTGSEIVLKAPIEELISKLHIKGFCDKNGKPIHRAPWQLLDEDQIVMLYSSINRGIQQYYRPTDNWARVQKVQYILKFSLAKTLAGKRKSKTSKVISGGDIKIRMTRKGKEKEIVFYQNHDWTAKRDGFTNSAKVDIVQMNVRLRTRSKLGLPCCICGEEDRVQMHHVRHIRKMAEKRAKGFTRVMSALNRKQIPVCARCHRLIHAGQYDGLSLRQLAYDPRRASLIWPPVVEVKINREDYPEEKPGRTTQRRKKVKLAQPSAKGLVGART